ncbi:complement factor D-like [Anticarsia gemmatalis]|uniref:complement factor D-like n=1 Tax=Anticarsia gemmatalis TaxID=129554 RepID=UPI003F75A796
MTTLLTETNLKTVFIIYNILFIRISVSKFISDRYVVKRNTTSMKDVFQQVVYQNTWYEAMADKCPLRIAGGKIAHIREVPYQVVIRQSMRGGRIWAGFCGGAIVTHKHILSAAHCFKRKRLPTMQVIAGTTEATIQLPFNRRQRHYALEKLKRRETWRDIHRCYEHARYNRRTIANDFALLELKVRFWFDDNIRPIKMARFGTVPDNTLCIVSGYGLIDGNTRNNFLRIVCLPVVPMEICRRKFGRRIDSEKQICAGGSGKDSCQGDSGGPMVCKGILIGIVSYGARYCGTAPGVYTLVSGYAKWMKKVPLRGCDAVKINYDVYIIATVLIVSLSYYYAVELLTLELC